MDSKVDFGVYHHSSREESEKLRTGIASIFNAAISDLKNKTDAERFTRGLDAGCGSGFVSHLLHDSFHNMHIWAIDNFIDSSLENNSMENATNNFECLGMTDSVTIVKADLRKIPLEDDYFNIAASSLVYHNLGRNFPAGIREVHRILENGGTFLYGDIFTGKRMGIITELFKVERTLKPEGMNEYSLLVLSKK